MELQGLAAALGESGHERGGLGHTGTTADFINTVHRPAPRFFPTGSGIEHGRWQCCSMSGDVLDSLAIPRRLAGEALAHCHSDVGTKWKAAEGQQGRRSQDGQRNTGHWHGDVAWATACWSSGHIGNFVAVIKKGGVCSTCRR